MSYRNRRKRTKYYHVPSISIRESTRVRHTSFTTTSANSNKTSVQNSFVDLPNTTPPAADNGLSADCDTFTNDTDHAFDNANHAFEFDPVDDDAHGTNKGRRQHCPVSEYFVYSHCWLTKKT